MLRNSFWGDVKIGLNSGPALNSTPPNHILFHPALESSIKKHVPTLAHTHANIWPASQPQGRGSTRHPPPSYRWKNQMLHLQRGMGGRKG